MHHLQTTFFSSLLKARATLSVAALVLLLTPARTLHAAQPPPDFATSQDLSALSDSSALPPPTDKLVGAAVEAFRQGDLSRARDLARRAVADGRQQAPLYKLLASTEYLLGEPQQFETHIRAALALAPDDADLHYHLARHLYEQQRYREAAKVFGRASTLDDEHYKARYYEGLLAEARGEPERAKDLFVDAIATIDRRRVRYVWPLVDLGRLLVDQGEIERGLSWLYRAVRTDPELPYAHYEYAKALLRQPEPTAEVERALRDAIRLDPGYASAYYVLARYYATTGDRQQANEMFAKLVADEIGLGRDKRRRSRIASRRLSAMSNASMKVWQIGRFGLDALEVTERPVPAPGPRELLVRVGAVSLNYRDRLVVEGAMIPDLPLPFVPASDAAGEVIALGEDVSRFRVGDRVTSHFLPAWIDGTGSGTEGDYVSLGGPLPGVLAEYVALDEQAVVATPPYLSDHEASTLPIAAVTAWAALVEYGGLRPGQTVLVEGTGGVSIFALQLAVAAGARVIVTSSSDERLARAKALGASDGVNYVRHPEWSRQVLDLTDGRGVDHIVEVVGGDNVKQAVKALARNGHLALIGIMQGLSLNLDIVPFMRRRAMLRGVLVGSRRSFESVNRALEARQIHPVIDKDYPFAEVPAAFEHLKRGAFGKVVVRLGA